MENKKLLFLCHDIFDLYKIFEDGLEKYSNCEVTTIICKKYKYKNNKERVLNFFSRKFHGKDLKKAWQGKAYFEDFDPNLVFDYAVTLCPDVFDDSCLAHVKKISKKSIVFYWDGFDNFPTYKDTIKYFDTCYSFDPIDSKAYKLNFLTNFYFVENRNPNPSVDVFFLSSFDSRYPLIEKIVNALEEVQKDIKINVLQLPRGKKEIIPTPISSAIEFISKPISMVDTTAYLINAKILLDIQKDIQIGLTFRVFEAMGLGKKLITTNKDIVNYDFYNPNNIFLWTEETRTIPATFLNTPYQELPIEIYKKYSQESWVNRLLEEI